MTRSALCDGAEGAVNFQATEPYDKKMMEQLVSAIQNLRRLMDESKTICFDLPLTKGRYRFTKDWSPGGWLPLDSSGRDYLRRLGLSHADVRLALNVGLRAGRVSMKRRNGVSYVGLAEEEVRR